MVIPSGHLLRTLLLFYGSIRIYLENSPHIFTYNKCAVVLLRVSLAHRICAHPMDSVHYHQFSMQRICIWHLAISVACHTLARANATDKPVKLANKYSKTLVLRLVSTLHWRLAGFIGKSSV